MRGESAPMSGEVGGCGEGRDEVEEKKKGSCSGKKRAAVGQGTWSQQLFALGWPVHVPMKG